MKIMWKKNKTKNEYAPVEIWVHHLVPGKEVAWTLTS